ncbi:hypothetical protein OHV05_04360 [Kitasatospora sp. NBC_00070]|uniref:phage tail protein n=1 Tax=Kitasatospora sp. NBC_00070 TaxID=2975962 RepID=UPI00324B329A
MPVRLTLADGALEDLRAQLRRITPPVVVPARVEADASQLDEVRRAVDGLGRQSGPANSKVGALLGTLGRLGSTLSAAGTVPGLASAGAGLAAMAPAAALAVPALLAVALANAALKLGLSGVSEALAGDADALAKLTPAARSFVTQVRALAPAWGEVRKSVQSTLFEGLDRSMTATAVQVLPALRTGLTGTATALNAMGHGVLDTAVGLAASGQFGKAVAGANASLTNLSQVPAVVLQALVQLGAGAAPAFARVTAGIGAGVESLSVKLADGLNSGGMQRAIDGAIALVRQLIGVLGSVGTIAANILGPAASAGGGLLAVVAGIAAQLAQLTGTAEAQATLKALFETLAAIGHAVSGVLGAALKAALPLLITLVNTLAGPVQQAVAVLGPVLEKLAGQLGQALGPAVSALASILATGLLPVAVQLIASLATGLGPVLILIGQLLAQVAQVVMGALQPILNQLTTGALDPLLAAFSAIAVVLADVAGRLLTALAPALATLGGVVGELLAKGVGPLIAAVGGQLATVLSALLPILIPIIELVGRLASVLATILSTAITGIVIPALRLVSSLLRGDFSGAWDAAKEMIRGTVETIKAYVTGIGTAVRDVVTTIPSVLGDLGGLLVSAGKDLIKGLLRGIRSAWGDVERELGRLTDKLPDWKGPPSKDRRILTPAGRQVMAGFLDGIRDQLPALKQALNGVTTALPALVGTSAGLGADTNFVPAPGQISDLVSAVDRLNARDIVIQIGAQEIARAVALGNRQSNRR